MTKRIFRSILGVSLAVLLASLVLIVGVLHGYFQDRVSGELESLAEYIAHGVEENGTDYLTEDLPGSYRITWVDADGTVLFDNRQDPEEMGNHAQREEIREALILGKGHAVRYSDTLSQQTLYAAQRLADGTVLRVSSAQYSVWVLVLQALQPVALMMLLAFILGLSLSAMKGKEIGDTLYNAIKDFSTIIDKVLHVAIVPLLPLYICGTFVDMTHSGKTFVILGILWKVFLVVIAMHLLYLVFAFVVAGGISHKNPVTLLKNQIPGYTTALGTQSSAATIPVNLQCAEADGISQEIRNFVVPLCANIHMAGSMITITSCATAVCLMNDLPISLATVVPFIATLGIAMVASPGAPGGSIMTALPFLYMVFGPEAGDVNGPICAIMVALYITQDSFGTACNVSGDNAIGVIVDTINRKLSKA